MSKTKEEIMKEFNEKVEVAKSSFEDYVKDLMTDLSNELKKIDNEKKKRFEVELPEDNTEVYFINDYDNTINFDDFQESSEDDETRFRNGMLFESAEEAEKFLKERRLLFKLRQWAKMKNEGWKPDWNNFSQRKFFVKYSSFSNALQSTSSSDYCSLSKLPCFKTEEIVEECIELFGDEIKEILIQNSQI